MTTTTDSPFLPAVPPHWVVNRFGRDIFVSEGQVDPRAEPWSSWILIAPNHIESGTGRLLGLETATEQGADSGKYLAKAGQVLYSKIRPGLNKVTLAPLDCLCSADMYAIEPRSGVNARYLAYYMRSQPFHSYASVTADRVKMPKINREELAAAPWARPPLPEQLAIVDFLDEQTSRIDTLIDKQTQLITTLRERRAGSVSAVLAEATASAPEDRLSRRSRIGNGSTPRRETMEYWTGGDYPWLNSAVVNDRTVRGSDQFVTALARRECHLPTVHPGAVLVGLTGQGRTRGMAAILEIEATVSQHIAYIQPDDTYWDTRFLFWSLDARYNELRRLSDENGSTKGGLTCGDLASLRIRRPSLISQAEAVERILEDTARVDAIIDKTAQHVALAKERRAALITAAVTGQIDVRTAGRATQGVA